MEMKRLTLVIYGNAIKMTLLVEADAFVRGLTPLGWVGILAALAAARFIYHVLYTFAFHPLSKYPGPPLAALTRLWFCWYSMKGEMIHALDGMHKRYGSVVRIAPDELSYTNPEAWNDIYGHRSGKHEVMKDPMFYSTISSGPGSIINADRARHGHLRKQASRGFSEKALRAQEHVIRKYADLMIQRLKENEAEGKTKQNIVAWFNFFTFDVMGDLVFGQSFDCLESSGYHPWVKLIFDSVKVGAFVRCSKYWPWLSRVSPYLVPPRLRKARVRQRQMAKDKGDFRKGIKDGREDLISGYLNPDSQVTPLEYQSTVETLIIAGSETTATAMSGTTYYLLRNPDKLKRLTTEIRSAFKSAEEINFNSVNSLPFLLACLNEALRMYPPVPDGFPRNTGPRPEVIAGDEVPPHTIVKVAQWVTFHSPDHFTRPNEFIPERWLDEGDEFRHDHREAVQPFHVGPRNCLGRNLAFVEMRLLMTILLWNFDLTLDSASDDWIKHKAFLLWEKPDMFVKFASRKV